MSLAPVPAALLQALQQVSRDLQMGDGDPLAPGTVLPGKVVADPKGGAPMLLLAGVRMPAQLPADLVLGQAVRLKVLESGPAKLLLQVVPREGAGPAAAAGAAVSVSAVAADGAAQPVPTAAVAAGIPVAPTFGIPMPGGAQVFLLDADADGDDPASRPATARTRSLLVRYESPVLGRADIVLRLGEDQLEASVVTAAGRPLALAREASGGLRAALLEAVGRPVAIQATGRLREDLDVRA